MIFSKLRSRNGHPSDAELVARIYKALRSYGPLYATRSPIQVEVNDGVAIVRGVVRGVALRHTAARLAAAVDGVETVRNELLDDPAIERAVAQALAAHPGLQLMTDVVSIESYHGEVTLIGRIQDEIQQMTAEAVARGVSGVKDVVNALIVSPEGNGHLR
jgi:hyperosmotically inducible protein